MLSNPATQLPKYFLGKGEVRGYKFTQIKSSTNAYLYRVDSVNNSHFDVFKKHIDTRYDKEYYPKSRSWGYSAWTFKEHKKAFRKFQELND